MAVILGTFFGENWCLDMSEFLVSTKFLSCLGLFTRNYEIDQEFVTFHLLLGSVSLHLANLVVQFVYQSKLVWWGLKELGLARHGWLFRMRVPRLVPLALGLPALLSVLHGCSLV